jgi:hypothetical protein
LRYTREEHYYSQARFDLLHLRLPLLLLLLLVAAVVAVGEINGTPMKRR